MPCNTNQYRDEKHTIYSISQTTGRTLGLAAIIYSSKTNTRTYKPGKCLQYLNKSTQLLFYTINFDLLGWLGMMFLSNGSILYI